MSVGGSRRRPGLFDGLGVRQSGGCYLSERGGSQRREAKSETEASMHQPALPVWVKYTPELGLPGAGRQDTGPSGAERIANFQAPDLAAVLQILGPQDPAVSGNRGRHDEAS